MTYVKKTHRFGLLTPSSNTVQEPEFSAALPPTVSLHTGRLGFRNIDAETMVRCVEELETESRKLADAEVDVIVFAATAPTLAKGKGYDRELIKRMEDASGRPATTAATAFVDALRLLGAKTVSIGAPWSKTMDKPMVEFMEASGFTVVHSEVVGFVASVDLGRVSPETAYELGRRADRPDADAIVMPGGNWASMPVVERLERELGKPVGLACGCSSERTVFRATTDCCETILPREVHRVYEQSEHNLCMKSFQAAHIVGSLRQEPLAEHLDFGKRRRRLRTDDPVRVGQSQGHIDRLDQTAVDQIPRRKRGSGQHNTLAVDGGIDQHARTVQHRSRNGGGGDAGGIEPSGPVLPVFETQQGKFQQIGCLGDAVASRNKLRRADRKKLLGAKAHGVEPGPIAVAMPNRKVHFLACEVDLLDRCGHAEVDVGMGFGKPAEAIHQPFGGKVRRSADRQHSGGLALDKTFRSDGNPVQRIADHGKIFAARFGDHQPLALAIEKFDPEYLLQCLDLMAHRSLRDIQFFSRPGEALAPRRGLEGLEGIQRWQTAKHRPSFMNKTKPE